MKVEFEIIGKNLIVRFNGELDHHTSEEIRDEIDKIYIDKGLKNIILDVKALNFMDSSGIGLIMGRYKKVSSNNGKVYLLQVNKRLKKILSMCGILKITEIYDDLNELMDNIRESDKNV